MPRVSTFTPISYLSTDGLLLSARDYAPYAAVPLSGPAHLPAHLPVICLHGLTRNASDFDEFAPLVASLGRRVLAPDVRGRGHSARDPDPDNYNPRVYAGDVVKLMADLGIARAVFVGTSMGGLITLMVAARNLDLVAAAILNDVGPVISEKGLARIAGYVGKRVAPASWTEAVDYVKDINRCAFPHNSDSEWHKWAVRAFAADAAGRLAPRYDPGIAIALQTGTLKPTSLALRMAFRKLADARPLLLVRGALSDVLEPRQAAWMQRAAPAMNYVEVPHVGHAPMLTEPAALDAIVHFLAAVP
jgi:pimeloyl-ACP methyl ester carboxylesterase